MICDKVFVHTGEMERRGKEYEFLAKDKRGFIHGEIRVAAIKILREQGKVKEIIVVGGPTKDGANKVRIIAKMIGGKVTQLQSVASTGGNIKAIKDFLGEDTGKNALLTNFYHIPRALRLITDNGLKIIPLCAEAILLTDDPNWLKKITEWYNQPSMLRRILSEIEGLSDIEKGTYKTSKEVKKRKLRKGR